MVGTWLGGAMVDTWLPFRAVTTNEAPNNPAVSSTEVRGIAVPAVSRWLEENISSAKGPFDFSIIAGGRSNLTYRVTDAYGVQFVLRRPPLGHVLATAHDMGREHRIISAVGKTSVPVPKTLGMCTDESVNGAPFYVMSFVDGVVLDSPEAGAEFPMELRKTAAFSMVDVLVELHSVEPSEIGLGDLGKREGYIERQLRRWSTQWQNSKTRELPIMEEVHARLTTLMPQQLHTGIVHGDYRLGNSLVSRTTGKMQAVLDWELCTLGDVLADVGYLLVYWADPIAGTARHNDPSSAPGFPTRAELLAHYAKASGRDLSGVAYYDAFSCWRLACISEGVLARYKAGVMGDDADTSVFDEGVHSLANRAFAALEALK
jgi:aminoglycoside phosphotransferase (APT) family kinase protein